MVKVKLYHVTSDVDSIKDMLMKGNEGKKSRKLLDRELVASLTLNIA